MDSDFVFVDPRKIPPRRAANSGVSGRIKIKRVKSPVYQNDLDEGEIPDFDLSDGSSLPVSLAGVGLSSADPLTRAIFAGLKTGKPGSSFPVRWPHQTQGAKLIGFEPEVVLADAKPAKNSRQAILAELENIDQKDAELAKKFIRVEPPRRDVYIDLVSKREPDAATKNDSVEIKLNIAPSLESADLSESDQFRTEDDWFRVSLAAPERIFELRELARRRPMSLRATAGQGGVERIEAIEPGYENGSKIRTYLATFLALAVPLAAGVFLFSEKDNFVASAFSSLNTKLLSTASFTLVNSGQSSVFTKLVEINSRLKSGGLAAGPADGITKFIEGNNNFGWLNIFKKKAGGGDFRLKSLEFLDSVGLAAESVSSLGESLRPAAADLKKYIGWLNFWDQLTQPDKYYLVITTDAAQAWPGGGRPDGYALVQIEEDGLETLSSGKFSALDGALNLKIVPPEPVKLISTAWLPSQAMWFLDFKESAQTLIDFFESVTQKKVDGAVALDKDFLRRLSFKESLLFEADSSGWFYGLIEALARKPNTRWPSLAEYLERGLASHQVQFYFKDSALEKFVEDSNWSLAARPSPQDDTLGISWASLDGVSPDLELIEYKINIFDDGSVMAGLSLMLKQPLGSTGRNYFKIYLPLGSQLLKAEGFSPPEKIPEFDYTSGGFSTQPRLNSVSTSGPGGSEIFKESGLTVAGGWVQLKSNSRNTLNLEYLLPFKLSRKKSLADYRLKVFRPHQNQDVPFRLVAVPQKGIQLTSLEPNGFVTENLGEYQGSLAQNLDLTATFIFGE